MAKTSIYLPDDLAAQVRTYGISISEVVQDALRGAVAASRGARLAKVRDQLVEEAGNTSSERLRIAEDYPDDARNIQCARTLDALAEYVLGLPDDDPRMGQLLNLDPSGELYDACLWRGENWSRTMYRLGFHGRGTIPPADALRELIDAAHTDAEEFERELAGDEDEEGAD